MCGHSSILHFFDNSYSIISLFGCVEDKLTDREMTRVRKVINSRDWFTGYSYYLVIVLLRWDAIVVCVKLGQCVTGRGYIELVVLLCSNVKIVSSLGKLRCVIFLVAWSIICDIYTLWAWNDTHLGYNHLTNLTLHWTNIPKCTIS